MAIKTPLLPLGNPDVLTDFSQAPATEYVRADLEWKCLRVQCELNNCTNVAYATCNRTVCLCGLLWRGCGRKMCIAHAKIIETYKTDPGKPNEK